MSLEIVELHNTNPPEQFGKTPVDFFESDKSWDEYWAEKDKEFVCPSNFPTISRKTLQKVSEIGAEKVIEYLFSKKPDTSPPEQNHRP